MAESLENASQEFLKFLVEVIYEKRHYFTVWGTDTADDEQDKWLVDTKQRILFFHDLQTLQKSVILKSNFLDTEKIKQWGRYLDRDSSPNNVFNFDLLAVDSDHLYGSLRDLYYLIGLIEDFAIQIDDTKMRRLFRSDLFIKFKDEAANTFLLEGQDEFDKDFDFIALARECLKIHKDLKGKISFPSL